MGRGAGPSKLMPSGSYPLPWHGHLNLFSLGFQSGVQPRWVQIAEMTKIPSVLRTTQMRYSFWNLVSTPNPKSEGYPILNWLFGSYSARGKKKRRNISRLTVNVPSTAAITNLRRRAMTLLSSASSLLEKMSLSARAIDGLDFGLGAAVPAGSN